MLNRDVCAKEKRLERRDTLMKEMEERVLVSSMVAKAREKKRRKKAKEKEHDKAAQDLDDYDGADPRLRGTHLLASSVTGKSL